MYKYNYIVFYGKGKGYFVRASAFAFFKLRWICAAGRAAAFRGN